MSLLLVSLYAGMVVYSFSELRGGIPAGISFENWRFLFERNLVIDNYHYPSIWSILLNTLLIAVGSMVVEVSISLFSGYALSKGNFPGKDFLIQSTLYTRALPAVTTLIASFYILKTMGLLDTYVGIILIKGLAEVGMSTWIIKGFFDELPKDIDWAASVDGSSKWRTFFRIYVPAIWPGIAAISLFAFLNGWGEYVMVSVLTFNDAKVTFPIILSTLMDTESTSTVSYGTIMAIATFYMLPALILYFFSQKYISKMKI
ncbi:carbohydrate ABC transporter permease [Brevibacillus choshinensis]|uniref:carbohydrate ABC transporter permease n=1 Tax=Brevibacillus choshinensis TaxID=54911 RepID=UPI002E206321|nr:carbohydrate ABC transporter permease [Brevibacillus choshinensis]